MLIGLTGIKSFIKNRIPKFKKNDKRFLLHFICFVLVGFVNTVYLILLFIDFLVPDWIFIVSCTALLSIDYCGTCYILYLIWYLTKDILREESNMESEEILSSDSMVVSTYE